MVGYLGDFRRVLESQGNEMDWQVDTAVTRLGKRKKGHFTSKNTNRRKGFLEENHFINHWGVRNSPYRFLDDEEMEIGGINLKDINTELEREGNGELTVINSGPGKSAVRKNESDNGDEPDSHMDRMADAGLKIVNPNSLISLSGDKAKQNRFFSELGMVPHWAQSDNYSFEGGIEALSEKLEPFENVPIISKPLGSSGGNGIQFRTVDELISDLYLEEERRGIDGALEGYIFQAALPVESDVRVIAFGDTPVTAEARYGREDIDLHNLSKMSGDYPVMELVESGAADPMDVGELDQAYVNAVDDMYDLLVSEDFVDGENTEMFLGHDFLVVDPDSDDKGILDVYPDDALDDILNDRYRTEDGSYLVFAETNASPGYKIDIVNYEMPWQHSALNLLKLADDFSRGSEYEVFGEGDLADSDLCLIDDYYASK